MAKINSPLKTGQKKNIYKGASPSSKKIRLIIICDAINTFFHNEA
jgi:hypothetical protein